ncbi:MAG: nuclear transport factor 2 family protein [Steroidobacteraceae bacterium]
MNLLEDNKLFVREFIAALSAGDMQKWYSMIADDCDHWVQGQGTISKQELMKATDAFCNIFTQPIVIRPLSMVAEGDNVAVEAESFAPLKAGGEYRNTYHFLYTVRNRKIVRTREYLDTLHLSQILAKANLQLL